MAIVSTPNMEYNHVIRFSLPTFDTDPRKPIGSDGRPMRDIDHKFEWTRAEFETWATAQAAKHGYSVTFDGVGIAMAEARWRKDEPGWADKDIGHATQVSFPVGLQCLMLHRVEVLRNLTCHVHCRWQSLKGEDQQAAPLPAADICGASKAFDGAAVTAEDVARGAAEYAQMRKEGFKAEAAVQKAPEGLEDLLKHLAAMEVPDEDICD